MHSELSQQPQLDWSSGRRYLLTSQWAVNWYRLDILGCSDRLRNGVVNLIVGRQIGSCVPRASSLTIRVHFCDYSSLSALTISRPNEIPTTAILTSVESPIC